MYLDDGQVFALLECLREVGQHVLADIEPGEEAQAGHGGGDAPQLIVRQVQLLQTVAVKQGPGIHMFFENCTFQPNFREITLFI